MANVKQRALIIATSSVHNMGWFSVNTCGLHVEEVRWDLLNLFDSGLLHSLKRVPFTGTIPTWTIPYRVPNVDT